MTEVSGPLTHHLKKDDVLCATGEVDNNLYLIHSGKVIVFGIDGTKVTPFAYLGSGEYFGELSFFDQSPRSANVVCTEPTTLIEIPVEEAEKQFPNWLITLATSMTKKIRHTDEVIQKKGIRRKNVTTIKPLSIEEQRHYYSLIKEYRETKGL